MLEDLIVELHLSFGLEGEAADLTLCFTLGGQVAVVFGSSGREFNNVVAWVQLIGEITKKIAGVGQVDRVLGRRPWTRRQNREPAERDDQELGRDGVSHGRW